jgi:hypothetical protein
MEMTFDELLDTLESVAATLEGFNTFPECDRYGDKQADLKSKRAAIRKEIDFRQAELGLRL